MLLLLMIGAATAERPAATVSHGQAESGLSPVTTCHHQIHFRLCKSIYACLITLVVTVVTVVTMTALQ
jgi:hypothetical protein